MVNLVAAQKPLLHGLMWMAGVTPHAVEIQPGTVMNFWVPNETIQKHDKPPNTTTTTTAQHNPYKPVVVLIHGFAAEGIVTWQFQVGSLTKNYSVYVPDLLFFGGSTTDNPDRSPTFQARCLIKGLREMGVEKCTVVGFSYGGMVAFKMAELCPDLVEAVVVSGSILAMTDSISDATIRSLGFSSSSELLLPSSVKGLKALLSVAAHKKLWFPDRLHKDFLEVMFNNRKERAELLEGLIVSNKDVIIPNFPQRILLLWGENDQIFKMELAQNMKEGTLHSRWKIEHIYETTQLGDKATYLGIEKAGHLVHLERPFAYNKCLHQFLATLQTDEAQK